MLSGNAQLLGMDISVIDGTILLKWPRNGRGFDNKVTHARLQVAHRLILGAVDHLYASLFHFIGFSLQIVE